MLTPILLSCLTLIILAEAVHLSTRYLERHDELSTPEATPLLQRNRQEMRMRMAERGYGA